MDELHEQAKRAVFAARGALETVDDEWDEYVRLRGELQAEERHLLKPKDPAAAYAARKTYEADRESSPLHEAVARQLTVVQSALSDLESAEKERQDALDAAFGGRSESQA